jgi:type I restriction enzyme S subunit
VSGGINFIRSQNVHDRLFDWSGLVALKDEDAHKLRSVSVEQNDILLNITGDSILRTCIVDPPVLPARVNQHVCIVRANDGIPPRYLHETLLLPTSKHFLLGLDAGGSRKAITKGHLEDFPTLLPAPQLLNAFEVCTTPIFEQVLANSRESRSLAQLRDLLLPKLMSGEIRLKDAEKAVEQVA